MKEAPAYCVNPTTPGVPQTVGPGESIKYLAEERASDPKVVGIISNGYPHRSLEELNLDDKYQAYYATKMALWCYLLPNWSINRLVVAPGLTGSELDIGNRILAAAKDIYTRGTTYTGTDETVTIPLTLEGHYTVTEEIPPRCHLLPEERAQHVDVEYGKTAKVTFWNVPYGSLRVEKISNTGDALSGVTIQIKHIETGETRTDKTSFAGAIVFDELRPGAWEVREIAGIEGWKAVTDTVQTVNVVAGEQSTASIVNEELPGLRVVKYDRQSMTLMPNVTFEIFRDNVSLGLFQTDEFGEILLVNQPEGSYRIEERHSGDDEHLVDTTPQYVELTTGMGIVERVFFNDRLPGIHLIKVDSADLSKPIANARFRFEAVDGSFGPVEYTTLEDGTIDLSKLPADTAYVVTELECPGYVIDDEQRIIHLDGNEQAQFVFTNSRLPSLYLYKTSTDNSPLTGVTYRLAKIEDGSR